MNKTIVLILIALVTLAGAAYADTLRGWTQDKGFGWVWGKDDQLGAIQAILGPDRVLKAIQSVKKGKVYDLRVPLDRHSYPGSDVLVCDPFDLPSVAAGREPAERMAASASTIMPTVTRIPRIQGVRISRRRRCCAKLKSNFRQSSPRPSAEVAC